jgi:hypothetical protein
MKLAAWLAMCALACSKSSDPAPAPAPAAHREDRHDPAAAKPALALAVTIDGATATWDQDVFARAPRMTGTASDGEARDTWSLRELVHSAVGPSARVIAIVGDTRAELDAAAWADAARVPILHTTRRGTLKFRWADPSGKWGDTVVKDVTRLEIAK